MSEAEAAGFGFEIDHYVPQAADPALANTYSNLMWSCKKCNGLKSSYMAPPEAQAKGLRYYRVDEDIFSLHFGLANYALDAKTATGSFTIEFLELNREQLVRIRKLRDRRYGCEATIAAGLQALKNFPIDQLPQQIRARVKSTLDEMSGLGDAAMDRFDETLSVLVASHNLEVDPNAGEAGELRRTKLKKYKAMYPGTWKHARQPRRT
jgi:hypothetical protein